MMKNKNYFKSTRGTIFLLSLTFLLSSFAAEVMAAERFEGPVQSCPGKTENYCFIVEGHPRDKGPYSVYFTITNGTSLGSNKRALDMEFDWDRTHFSCIPVTWGNTGTGTIKACITYEKWYWFLRRWITVNKCITLSVKIGYSRVSSISGPSYMNANSTSTFSVPSWDNGTRYLWTAPSGWKINGGSNVGTVTSKSVRITAGSSPVKATISVQKKDPCGYSDKTYKAVELLLSGQVIKPSQISISASREEGAPDINRYGFCPNYTYYLTASAPGALEYRWGLDTDATLSRSFGTYGQYVDLTTTSNMVRTEVWVQARNAYGWSAKKYKAYYNQGCPKSAGSDISESLANINEEDNRVMLTPNPAQTTATLAMPDIAGEKYIRILTSSGQVVQTLSVSESETLLNLNSLTKGIYLVNVICEGESYTKRLVKE